MCGDRQMGQNSMFFIIFGSILLLCYIFCTAWLNFYSESFSPLLQIRCNHEFNILSTAFNGMQFKLLTCLVNNLFTTNNFWIANGWISIWKWSSVFHSISLQFQWRLRMLLGILVWYLIVLTCIINGSGFGSPNI